MKNLVIFALVLVAGLTWLRNHNGVGMPTVSLPDVMPVLESKDTKPRGAREVVMYATPTCGYCKKARRFFAEHRIPYTEKNVNASAEASREMRALGGRGVPTILIDDEVIRGWNEQALRKSLL